MEGKRTKPRPAELTAPERGWLLLCAELEDGRKPLTRAQVRALRAVVTTSGRPPEDPARPLEETDLRRLGCDEAFARRIADLLSREEILDRSLSAAAELGIRPVTSVSAAYPARLRRLGDRAPSVLFCRGDVSLLTRPAVALVGCRDLSPAGCRFARRVGELAAREGWLLVSGNARGADREAQDACLAAGGFTAAFLPDALSDHAPACARQLFLSDGGWGLCFTAFRALERNRFIHALGEKTLVAQAGLAGGTRTGSEDNLRLGLSPLFVHDDGSPGSRALTDLGAVPVRLEDLTSLRELTPAQTGMAFRD